MARINIGTGTTKIPQRPAAPRRRIPVRTSPVLGAPSASANNFSQPRQQAARQTTAAEKPVLRRTTVPYVPQLRHPTPAQRNAQVQTVGRGLKRQGVTNDEVRRLRRGEGSRQQQQAVRRYVANVAAEYGRLHPTAGNPRARRGSRSTIGVPLIGTVDPTYLEYQIGARLAGNPLAAFGKGLSTLATTRLFSDKGVIGRTANDLLTYPAAAIPTVYNTVETGLTKGPVAGARTVTDPIVHSFEHPVETFREHPLFAALLAHGSVAAAGRTVGAVGRAAGADFAQTARSSLGVAGESGARLNIPRQYSKSVIHKAAQAAYDRRLQPVRDRAGNAVRDSRGRVVLAAPAGRGGRLIDRRGDFVASRANAVERNTRAIVGRYVAKATPGGRIIGRTRPERELVAMAMEGTIRPSHALDDLRKERQRLDDAYRGGGLDPLERKTNRLRAQSIDRVLRNPRAQRRLGEVFQTAADLAAGGNRLSREAVAQRMLDPQAAERAKLFPYAQSHMGAKPVEHADGTVTVRAADGTFLANDQIRQHMQANGINPDHIAYLPHRPDVRGARAFHQQFRLQRRNLDQESRTGAAYAKGATSSDYQAVVEHLTRQAGLVRNAQQFDRLVQQAGVKHPSGEYFTWREAQAYAKHAGRAPNEATDRLLPGEPDLVPVRAFPAKYDAERAQAIQNEQSPAEPGAGARLVEEQNARLTRPDPTDPNAPNVVLVPRQLADRLGENLQRTRKGDRPLQAINNAFRTTVLPFSAKWLTGNIAEALIRLAAVGARPGIPKLIKGDVGIGKALIEQLHGIDQHAAEEVQSHLIGGLLYGERGLTNRRGSEAFGPKLGAIGHAPVVRELGATVRAVTKPIFALNRAFEQGAQYAALGKYARREIQDFTGSWTTAVRAQRTALHDVARGLTETAAQEDAARYLDETLGKYSRFTPFMRHVIQTYAPFLPWYLNSIRFVLWTLPAHHPIKTAALTQAEQAFEQDWKDQHKDIKGVAPDLMTAIPSGRGFVDAARYTPFGFPGPLATGDYSSAAGVVLPQVSGLQLALMGKDPFGGDLTAPKNATNHGKPTAGQNALIALNQAAESFIPGLALARRLREHGGTPYSTSTVIGPEVKPPKAGVPQPSAVSRAFNPLRPVYVSPKSGGSGPSVKLDPVSRAELRHAVSQGARRLDPVAQAELDAYLKGGR
jgi:hypothetical protein